MRILSLLLLATTLNAAPLERDLTPAIERALKDTGIPALAIAVVKDDRVVYQHTFGAQRVFYIASSTKSFTALAAKLAKLDLDAPLTKTLPKLALPAPLDPARMSLRDLLTHRLGFANDAVVWRTAFTGEWTDDQLFAILAKSSEVRPRQFAYDNLGYVLASYALENATGEEWQATLAKSIFEPLGMRDTTATRSCVDTKSPRTMHAAGGVCTTIADLTRWLRVQMSDGVIDGKRVFPLTVMRETHAPQINLQRKFGRIDRYAYALGWYHGDYDGDLLMHHFGSYNGARAHVSWMPDRHAGVVVVVADDSSFADSAALLAYDLLLGKADARKRFDDDVAAAVASHAKRPERLAAMRQKLIDEAADSDRALASYAGSYVSEPFGTIVVREENGALTATWGDMHAPLVRVRGDVFTAQWFADDAPDKIAFRGGALTWHEVVFVTQ